MNKTCDETPYISINHSSLSNFCMEKMDVHVGQCRSRIRVVNNTSIKKPELVSINRQAGKVLLLPDSFRIDYKVINHSPLKIKLGPVVGILTTVNRNSKSGLPIGKEAYYFEELISYASQNGVFIYLFYPAGVDWKKQTIKGYTLNFHKYISNKWVEGEYPFPDIVYNRIRSRNVENSMLELLDSLKDAGMQLFNTRFLDKWDVHNALQKSPRVMTFLPPTALFNYDNLLKFLQEYKEVFLKPRNSSIGKGIIKVKKTSGYFMFALAQSAKPFWHRYGSPEKLYEALIAAMEDTSRYLVQKGIPLAKIQNRVFDLRAQVQKNGKGIWSLTGIAVRAAAPERFITHIPNGGSARPYNEVIGKVFGNSPDIKQALQKQLQLIINEIPLILENMTGWSLAVLSLDIGIDRDGNMWIIEINSKPSSFDEPDIRQTHLKYFTEYCKYITFIEKD